MQLACLFFLSVVALCSLKISRAEIPHGFDLLLNGSNEGETEDNDIIVRRAVRKTLLDVHYFLCVMLRINRCTDCVSLCQKRAKAADSPAQLSCGCRPRGGAHNSQSSDYFRQYPEDSEDIGIGHRQASIRVSPVECNCPEVLAKGTLVAIVAALAFLSFFSITILLVVAICILRLVEKQKKKEKEEKPARSSHRRLVPPVPPPRPEHTYMTVQPLHGYERLHPASPRAARGIYLSASELHPGPRVHREKGYQSASVTPPGAKSTRENEYIGPDPAPSLSTPPLDKSYTSADKTGSQTGSIQDTVRSPLLSPKGRDNHIYEEVE
ncbi:uncharacterized protein LOC121936330 [Sceloporus undulatus]|uniref:uncharacterized protein LOC121936330 n=1 Tax=Sceloporus undulatus TaxID=8520 RepID=UPI001C4CD92C|nr:uncharacterized protein LOC121936330 [Sceloporus undulatus]